MKRTKTRALCEGAVMVALATALSYVKFFELPQGGSVCIGMLPIFLYCIRWGWKDGFLASFAYGLSLIHILRKIGDTTVQPDNAQTKGKIAQIGYLLQVTEQQ